MRKAWWIPGLVVVVVGCASGPKGIKEYEPRQRDYEFPVETENVEATRREGSLWSASYPSNYLYADQRAVRVGDILTVQVEEFASAQRATSTSASRSTELNAEVREFLGLIRALQQVVPGVPVDLTADVATSLSASSEGDTGRSEQLTATVQVVVKQALPNGNLFVEGHRVILVNAEEHHFYLSGVARAHDIDEYNTISSAKLADAEIEFTGRGVLSEGQNPGGFTRFLNRFWPF